jgi:hypothetical protein
MMRQPLFSLIIYRHPTGLSSDEVNVFILPNPSSRTMALGSTQPLTEISIGNLLGGGEGWPVCKADVTAVCEPTV